MDLFTLFGTISVKYADAVEEIDKVTQSAREAGGGLEEMSDSAQQAQDPIADSGESAQQADSKFGAWAVTLGNLAANVITRVADKCADLAKDVIDLGTDFTATMSEVQAISGATDAELAQLEETARAFGASTVFSANDAAQALKYMSLAGWSVEESTSALGGVLDLAAASGMELASASDMVTDYLSAFGMGADQAAYFADLLAYAQSNSNTTAEQLGEAYRNCAANLNAAGQDVETVTSLLEAMANQGYKGSEAGTALTAIMRDITGAMDDGKIAIGDASISVMDASGDFRDLTDILAEVEAATNGMGAAERAAAMSAVFTADSTKGLNLLLNEGLGSIAGYEEALRGADGAAADMAATMNDNLKGDIAAMNSAFDELKLKIFEGAENPLRGLVQFVTDKAIPMLTNLVDKSGMIVPVIVSFLPLILQLAEGVFPALLDVIGQLLPPVTELVASVLPVVMQLLGMLLPVITRMTGAVLPLAVRLIQRLLPVLEPVLGLLEPLLDMLSVLIVPLADLLDAVLPPLIDLIVMLAELGIRPLQQALTVLTRIIGAVAAAFGVAAGAVRDAQGFFESFGAYLYDWIAGVIENVLGFLSRIGTAVRGFFATIGNAVQVGFRLIGELFSAFVQLISLPWRFLWENCRDTVVQIWESIRDLAVRVWTAIADFIWDKLTAIRNAVSAVFTAVRDAISERLNAARNTVSLIFEAVRSTISDKLTAARTIVTTVFDTIRDRIREKIQAARDIVKNAIDRIRGFFNFKWDLPKLKLPHFNITGSFSLDPPSVPHFGIDWYAKGGILQQPTVFGYDPATGRAQAGGEAGAEAVAPIDTLLGFVRTAVQEENAALYAAVDRILGLIEMYFPQLIAAIPQDVVLDSGALVGELVPEINEAMGEISEDDRRRRG